MKIRDYTPKDKTKLKSMVGAIIEEVFDGDANKTTILNEFDSQKNYLKFLIVEEGDNIIACMGLKKINKTTLRLKRIYVRLEYQKRGIAQKLLDELIKFAKENNFKKIKMSFYPIMENANKFLEKNNFKKITGNDPLKIHVIKTLD